MKRHLLTIIFSALFIAASAQSGTIRGKVIDNANGEPMFGVTVALKGTTTGAVTDFEGAFSIKTAPGTYALQISFISYKTINVTNVVVSADQVTALGTIRLSEDIETLEDVVVVTAEAIKSSETALLTVKRKSANLLDGISSESFSRIGDSDAGGAIRRVPGVSVEGGQYVYVRGLGDRYTKTILNGVNVPGLDPDRNAIQIDIFPTNIIGNIVVYKTFTPDLGADFVGGTVNIETKEFPEEKTLKFSVNSEFNPTMHFNDQYVEYAGGGTDFLGIDDGTRELPFDSRNDDIPSPSSNDPRVSQITRSFNPTMAAQQSTSNPNFGFGISAGNQSEKDNHTLGYNAALSYSNKTTFFENAVDNYYIKPNLSNEFQLETDTDFSGPLGVNDVQWNALLGGAVKTNSSKVSAQMMHIQNGISRAANRLRVRSNENSNVSVVDNLEYTERSLSNLILTGQHNFSDNSLQLDWAGSTTFATIDDKDVRITPFTVNDDDGSLLIRPSEGGEPNRIWRSLSEQNYVAKADLTKTFEINGNESKLKGGLSNVYKEREFRIDDFFLSIRGDQTQLDINGDPDRLLGAGNAISEDTGIGVAVQDRFVESNSYEGRINILGTYVMGEIGLTPKLKTILGVRVEQYSHFYTGLNQEALGGVGGRVFNDDLVLETLDLFPSLNFIYNVVENSNLRASYSRTTARPSFKELSTAEIQDVLTGLTFVGNIDLQPTYINNFDVRYEMFFKRGQTISLGAFYKTFENPIELVFFENSPTDIQPRNVGDATILGAEVEARKNLGFISSSNFFNNLAFTTNVTITSAAVKMDPDELQGRINTQRDGETIDDERDFLGQPPYIINAGLNYNHVESGWDGSLSYNIQGPTLFVVGSNRVADNYTVPFNSLNFNVSKQFGAEFKNKLSLRVTNILGDIREREFQSFGSNDVISFSRDPGTSFRIQYVRNIF